MSSDKAFSFWWLQRLTAVLLSVFFLCFVFCWFFDDYDHLEIDFLILHPFLSLSFFLTVIYHSFIGLYIILEDYVHNLLLRRFCNIFLYSFLILSSVQVIMIFTQHFFIDGIR
ncbi:succinate dehydrogenase, hydrophobic membrane anchor protein [Anaplasmataceae bacterium AB001_6]|nr:succinate dehydrogenase, hydrophobic membrane anchor protein [Anaplasmataceae bacterium AB001_6]